MSHAIGNISEHLSHSGKSGEFANANSSMDGESHVRESEPKDNLQVFYRNQFTFDF